MTCLRCGNPMRETLRASDDAFIVYACVLNGHTRRVGETPPEPRLTSLNPLRPILSRPLKDPDECAYTARCHRARAEGISFCPRHRAIVARMQRKHNARKRRQRKKHSATRWTV